MEKNLHKIILASTMFEEAHERYIQAKQDIDYIVSILLSGAVVGIVAPVLKEQGGQSTHDLLARISKACDVGDLKAGAFRAIYNALKHAGNDYGNVLPSEDLVFEADLKKEAAFMLDAAKDDFQNIEVTLEVRKELSQPFVDLLESHTSYSQ